MRIELTDKDKLEILKVAYAEVRKEIGYIRQKSWKVTTWVIGVYFALSGGTILLNRHENILILPVLGLAIVASIYQHENYKTYCDRWNRLGEIEDALGFFEKGIYIESSSLLPEEKKKPKVTYKGTAFFILAIWIMAISVIMAILYK